MSPFLRKLGALLGKDAADLAKNPTMVLCVALPVGFALFYRFFLGDMDLGSALRDESATPVVASAVTYVVLSMGLCMSIGMGASMSLVYGIAEEKEKHTLRTLMLANVTANQIVLAKGILALLVTVATEILCFLVSGAPFSLFLPYAGFGILGAIAIILLSLVAGLASRDQMTAGLYSVPILLLALAPIFGSYSSDISNVVRFAPTGGMDALLHMAVNGTLTTAGAMVPLATTVVWIALSALCFSLLYKRLLRDN